MRSFCRKVLHRRHTCCLLGVYAGRSAKFIHDLEDRLSAEVAERQEAENIINIEGKKSRMRIKHMSDCVDEARKKAEQEHQNLLASREQIELLIGQNLETANTLQATRRRNKRLQGHLLAGWCLMLAIKNQHARELRQRDERERKQKVDAMAVKRRVLVIKNENDRKIARLSNEFKSIISSQKEQIEKHVADLKHASNLLAQQQQLNEELQLQAQKDQVGTHKHHSQRIMAMSEIAKAKEKIAVQQMEEREQIIATSRTSLHGCCSVCKRASCGALSLKVDSAS